MIEYFLAIRTVKDPFGHLLYFQMGMAEFIPLRGLPLPNTLLHASAYYYRIREGVRPSSGRMVSSTFVRRAYQLARSSDVFIIAHLTNQIGDTIAVDQSVQNSPTQQAN